MPLWVRSEQNFGLFGRQGTMGPKVGVRKVGKFFRPGGPKCAETRFLGRWHQNKKIIFDSGKKIFFSTFFQKQLRKGNFVFFSLCWFFFGWSKKNIFSDMRSENVIFVICEKPSVWLLFRAIWAFLTPNYEKNRNASGPQKFAQGVHFDRFSVIFTVLIADPIGNMEETKTWRSGPKFCDPGGPKWCKMRDSWAI